MKNLCKRDSTIIAKADKGGAIAIFGVDNYVQEANRQLFKLTIETTEINRIKVNRTINELKSLHLLDKKIANYLLSSEAKTPQFKIFPKVHNKQNSGGPVLSSIVSYTTKVSKNIDH